MGLGCGASHRRPRPVTCRADPHAATQADLRHYEDRVSIQSAGAEPNSSGPEACLASAPLQSRLDDGEQHWCRIILVKNQFGDSSNTHRLLVFVDDENRAAIDLTLSLSTMLTNRELVAGFTASTGKRHASHKVTNWRFTEVVPKAQEPQGWLARARGLVGA